MGVSECLIFSHFQKSLTNSQYKMKRIVMCDPENTVSPQEHSHYDTGDKNEIKERYFNDLVSTISVSNSSMLRNTNYFFLFM